MNASTKINVPKGLVTAFFDTAMISVMISMMNNAPCMGPKTLTAQGKSAQRLSGTAINTKPNNAKPSINAN